MDVMYFSYLTSIIVRCSLIQFRKMIRMEIDKLKTAIHVLGSELSSNIKVDYVLS